MTRDDLNYCLQQAELPELELLCTKVRKTARVELIRKPTSQTLLLPVHDPINQGSFYGGEVLATSCIMQVNGNNGWAMVMDDAPEMCLAVATLDAAYAADMYKQDIIELAEQAKKRDIDKAAKRNTKVNSTRVSFDLL